MDRIKTEHRDGAERQKMKKTILLGTLVLKTIVGKMWMDD